MKCLNFVPVLLTFATTSALAANPPATLAEAQKELAAKRTALVQALNLVSKDDAAFAKHVESAANLLESHGMKGRAEEIRTLSDPAVRKLTIQTVKDAMNDTSKNTVYFWIALSSGDFCGGRDKNGYVTDGLYPLGLIDPIQTTLYCLLDIGLAAITLGEVQSAGQGEF